MHDKHALRKLLLGQLVHGYRTLVADAEPDGLEDKHIVLQTVVRLQTFNTKDFRFIDGIQLYTSPIAT